jgi:hypothetical protein
MWAPAPRPLGANGPPQHLLTPWSTYLNEIESALATGDPTRAARAWPDAWTAAHASRRWEPLLDVGDAALRIGAATNSSRTARTNARQAYRAALFRARAQHSVDGVLRTADAFAGLGDREMTEGALHAARKLAAVAPDAGLRTRVEVDAARIGARVVAQ